mmetsp:Transcript_46575/g.149577  ORF Transcript_46575/g.149577 Transcript_46575/m.149577 type:complete len:251 (+) Transcript_46575:216-968(+)
MRQRQRVRGPPLLPARRVQHHPVDEEPLLQDYRRALRLQDQGRRPRRPPPRDPRRHEPQGVGQVARDQARQGPSGGPLPRHRLRLQHHAPHDRPDVPHRLPCVPDDGPHPPLRHGPHPRRHRHPRAHLERASPRYARPPRRACGGGPPLQLAPLGARHPLLQVPVCQPRGAPHRRALQLQRVLPGYRPPHGHLYAGERVALQGCAPGAPHPPPPVPRGRVCHQPCEQGGRGGCGGGHCRGLSCSRKGFRE